MNYKHIMLACTASLGLCMSAAAGVLASDRFDQYKSTPTTRDNLGTGWAQGWQTASNIQTAVIDEGNGAFVEVTGGNASRALSRNLLYPAGGNGSPLYLRWDFTVVNDQDAVRSAFGCWYFVDSQGYRTTLNALVSGFEGFAGARVGEVTSPLTQNPLESRRRYVLIAKLDGWDLSKLSYTTTTVWLDPVADKAEDEQLPGVTARSDSGSGLVTSLVFRTYNLGHSAYRMHEIRLADSWGDVVNP